MLDQLNTHGMTLLALLGSDGPRPIGRRSTNFIENMCGGAAETSEWCQWQVYGLGALSIGGLWLLFQLAKWRLAPKDERETPQLLALVLASVILVGGIVTLGSNEKPMPSDQSSEQDAPQVDPQPLIDPNG
ncbi:MAG: hypothetical protein GY895_07945 [Phycisphaera sp.]|nr:hypothetical protein [Phycisphaera sp.]